MKILKVITAVLWMLFSLPLAAEDGYRLWLRNDPVDNRDKLTEYREMITGIRGPAEPGTGRLALRELEAGLSGLLGQTIESSDDGSLWVGTPKTHAGVRDLKLKALKGLGREGYVLTRRESGLVLAANDEAGLLYGAFHLLRLIRTGGDLRKLNVVEKPALKLRVLNHWDDVNGHVERGYAGRSLWDWHRLPGYLDPRYTDYARACASLGINGTVLTNVNADALVLTPRFIEKTRALADLFRPWGIRVYLTARFSAPEEIGGLDTADPLNERVVKWWEDKTAEIYAAIPDFGGFLVKANSEGQPGPQDYGRSHVQGANMLAKALAPHGGVVMWRAFVYGEGKSDDRVRHAYDEFMPLDGKFLDNVMIQVKNGPIDFQPREPFHPLFGGMRRTPLMMEFQITQEYLGFSTHLVYLGSTWQEVLRSDTRAKKAGATVTDVIDGGLDGHAFTGMAGVANAGSDRNWTGHPFAQANWYAFGRLAWDPHLDAAELAEEWIRQTWGRDPGLVATIKEMMMGSHQAAVDYRTPLGLHHLMGGGNLWHHYGPAPWDQNNPYYHKADKDGIGYDRSPSGSGATAQYHPLVATLFGNRDTCPEDYLLWFHHVGWDEKLKSGRTLWEEMVHRYDRGVEAVENMVKAWKDLKGQVNEPRHTQVKQLLDMQLDEARWWRDACLAYFQSVNGRPWPKGVRLPKHDLEYYKSLTFPEATM